MSISRMALCDDFSHLNRVEPQSAVSPRMYKKGGKISQRLGYLALPSLPLKIWAIGVIVRESG